MANYRHETQTDVGGWTIDHYAQIVKWPSVGTVVLNIIATTAHWNTAFVWLFLIALTVFLGIATARMYRGTLINAVGLGFSAGLIVGVFTSLFQFLWFHTVAAFFQMITTALLSILLGLLMSTSAFLAFSREHSIRRQKHTHH